MLNSHLLLTSNLKNKLQRSMSGGYYILIVYLFYMPVSIVPQLTQNFKKYPLVKSKFYKELS